MIHFPVVQGSEEWHGLRHGRPNASEFEGNIITAKKWEPVTGQSRRRYSLRLVTEQIFDVALDTFVTPAMLHGKDWEPKARAAYEMQRGVDVEPCGYCTNDEGTVGASPDAFVGKDGLLEIKCPEQPYNHLGYYLAPETLRDEYWVQVQGQLYITGRKWTDLISYFMNLPMACVRITPHPEFQKKLDEALRLFINDLALMVDLARERGIEFAADRNEVSREYHDWLTEEDVEAHLASLRAKEKRA